MKSDMEDISYQIIRSKRKTVSIVVDENGEVEVRIPNRMTLKEAAAFVEEKHDWILRAQSKQKERLKMKLQINWDDLKRVTYPWIRSEGGKLFREKVASFAELMGVDYVKLSVKDTMSMWGSCTTDGNISFSWKLFTMPERIVNYLIVHELSHRKHMNHSEEFWDMVGEYCPEYKEIRKELKLYN